MQQRGAQKQWASRRWEVSLLSQLQGAPEKDCTLMHFEGSRMSGYPLHLQLLCNPVKNVEYDINWASMPFLKQRFLGVRTQHCTLLSALQGTAGLN